MSDTKQEYGMLNGGTGSYELINFLLVDKISNDIHVRFRMKSPMGKLKKIYSDIRHVPEESLTLLYDGLIIDDHATPEELEMKGYEVIEVCRVEMDGDGRVSR